VRTAAPALKRLPELASGLPRAALRLPPRLRRRLAASAALGLLLMAGYLFWFRDSSLVAIDNVTITGLTTEDAPRVREALMAVAHDMTTLHVKRGELEQAVRGFPIVRSLEVQPDFPSTLRIQVVEEQPRAIVVAGAARVAVSADGAVLRGLGGARLPTLRVDRPPASGGLTDPTGRRVLAVLAAAPRPIAGRLRRGFEDRRRGIVVKLRRGPEIVFGDATRVDAKWSAALGVLADRSSRGARYVDVRIPGRPAAGGLADAASTDEEDAAAAAASAAAPVQPVAQQAVPAPGAAPVAGSQQTGGVQAPASRPQAAPAPAPSPAPAAGANPQP
jgi:cell division protein FtsQ